MQLTESEESDNNFARAYNALTKESKSRAKHNIMINCGISEKTFYSWLKNPDLLKDDRVTKHFIADTVFEKEVQEIFPKK